MVDQLIYDADELIKNTEKKVKAFESAWIERGQELNNAGMPDAAKSAHELAMKAKEECNTLNGLLEHNKRLLSEDKKLDKVYDKLKDRKMYA